MLHNHCEFLICPICRKLLNKVDFSLVCDNKHCFDIAKESYVNLLPAQHKKSKNPGDNRTMIRCRKNFLNKAYYQFLIPEIISLIQQHQDAPIPLNFLDSGCGEGYFIDEIERQLDLPANYYAMDISREAIRLAARRNKNICWFVASSNNIPIQDCTLDVVLKINAPINYLNIKNKLSANAFVISITPGEQHLEKLRELMYLKPTTHKQESVPDGFIVLQNTQIKAQLSLSDTQDIHNLFKMTPYYWNASSEAKKKHPQPGIT